MSDAATEFWTENEEYHELARQFEEGINLTHPKTVTSRRMCVCLEFTSWCAWAATSVDYYEYNGPRV